METKYNTCLSPEKPTGCPPGEGFAVDIEPDLGKMRAYAQAKFALADQLRIVREALTTFGREQGQRRCFELMVQLAEDRFALIVLGQFMRGKSSLINAVIGRELLPTGVGPVTSAITVLKYGPDERFMIRRDDSIVLEKLPIAALPDYVAETGNPANRKMVQTAYVELPLPFLRFGIEFIDTPGFGSAITADAAKAFNILPKYDAAIFVTGIDTPLTDQETALLKKLRESTNKIFFVVNKIDLTAAEAREGALGYATRTIRARIEREDARVFPVSTRQGLAAKTYGDPVFYERSGLRAFEEALSSFLSEEKAAGFLSVIADEALRILDDEAALTGFEETSANPRSDTRTAAAALIRARAKLKALAASPLAGRWEETQDTEVPPSAVSKNGTAAATDVVAPMPADEVLAADLRTRGCPVCRHIAKEAKDFFADWQYRLGSEERTQEEFAEDIAFCPLHTWQLVAMSSPRGASIGYARLAERVARRLKENIARSPKKEAGRSLVRDSRNCRVCVWLRRVEEAYIRRLAAWIGDEPGRNLYRQSQGVCLRHLGLLADATSSRDVSEFVLAHAARCFEEDAAAMRSYVLKHEALRRGLQNRDERDAYRRTVNRIVGGRNLCRPWAEEGEIY